MGSDWQKVTLGDAAVSVQTGPFGSQLHKADYVDEGIPSIMPVNISDNRITTEGIARITEADAERLSKYRVETGDVVYSRRGDVERRALVREAEDGWLCGTGCLRVRFDKARVNPEYASFQLGSARCREWIVRHAIGATMPNLNTSILSAVPFILPPLHEQKAIAHILGTLDDKIELNRRMNATLEGMAQALFKSWFVDFDPVIDNALAAGNPIPDELAPRAEVRRQALASSDEPSRTNGTTLQGSLDHPTLSDPKSFFPSSFQFTEELGWIPEGWHARPLAEEVQLTMGQSPSSDHYNTEGNGLPFHQGVTNYGTRFPKHEQFSTGGNRYAGDGDVLFSVRAPVGRINLADRKLIIGRGLAALRHKKNYQGYLIYFLKQTFATEDSIGSGTIFNAVNKKEMERIPLIVPPDDTTRAFDNFVDSLDEKIASNAEQTDTLTKLRDTLLPKLISGELKTN